MKPLPSGLPTSVDGKADRGVKNRKSAFLISSWLLVTPVFFLFFGSSPFSPDDEHWKSSLVVIVLKKGQKDLQISGPLVP